MSYSRLRTLYLAVFVVFPTLIFGQNAVESPNVLGTAVFTSGPCGAQPTIGKPCQSDESIAKNIEFVFSSDQKPAVIVRTDRYGFLKTNLAPGRYILSVHQSRLIFLMPEQEIEIEEGRIIQLNLRVDLLRQ